MQLKHLSLLTLSSLALAAPTGQTPSGSLSSSSSIEARQSRIGSAITGLGGITGGILAPAPAPEAAVPACKARRQTASITGPLTPFDNQIKSGQQDISELIRKVAANTQDIAALKDQDAQHSADIAKIQSDIRALQQKIDALAAVVEILKPLADPEIVGSLVESTMSAD